MVPLTHRFTVRVRSNPTVRGLSDAVRRFKDNDV